MTWAAAALTLGFVWIPNMVCRNLAAVKSLIYETTPAIWNKEE